MVWTGIHFGIESGIQRVELEAGENRGPLWILLHTVARKLGLGLGEVSAGAFHGIIIRFILILSQCGHLQKQDKIIK